MATDDDKPEALTLVDIDKQTPRVGASVGERPKCEATRKDGQSCGAFSAKGSSYCLSHDPAKAADREEWRKAGGHASSTASRTIKSLPADLRPVLTRLLGAIDEVHSGKLEPQRAQAMAGLARATVTLFQTVEIEERMAKIEEQLASAGTASGAGKMERG